MVYVNSVKIDESIIYLTLNDVFYNPRVIISPSDATCPYVEWSTSHPDVVSVDPHSGNIRALKTGTALVYATAADGSGVRDHIMVRVQEGAVTNVDVIESHLVLPINGSGLLHLDLTPSTATYADITWESTKPNVASVTNGVVCANSLGSTIVYARATGSYSIFDTCYVTVTSVENPVTSITLNHLYATKPVNTTFSLIATVTPSNATNKTIEWASSNPNVATVDQNGCVTTKREGGTTITASSTDGGGVVAHCSVQVIPIPVTGIELSEQDVVLKIGGTKDLIATIQPYNAADKTVTWFSCDENIASVINGKIAANALGKTDIYAVASNGITQKCTVRVVIEDVIITESNGTALITFKSSGKQWRCVREDMVFNDTNSNEQYLLERANFNLYKNPERNPITGLIETEKRTYTNDEIKLLYSIDPFGVAHYINNYANSQYDELIDILNYKDDIFRLLFNRSPKYFKRKNETEWEIFTGTSSISEIISESETVFGMHAIWDDITTAQLWQLGVMVIELAVELYITIKYPQLTLKSKIIYNTVENLLKALVLVKSGVNTIDLFELVQDELSSKAFEDTGLEWANDIVSSYKSLYEVITFKISSSPNLNGQIIKHCAEDCHYNVSIQMANKETFNLSEVYNIIEQL